MRCGMKYEKGSLYTMWYEICGMKYEKGTLSVTHTNPLLIRQTAVCFRKGWRFYCLHLSFFLGKRGLLL